MPATMNSAADASRRFVLGDDAPLARNLAALWAVDPQLAAAIEALRPGPAYPTEPSRAGPPTVAVEIAGGRKVHLHSRHHPIDEAKRLVDPIDFDARFAFYVHGFGLGYHVQQIFDRAGD